MRSIYLGVSESVFVRLCTVACVNETCVVMGFNCMAVYEHVAKLSLCV